MSNAIEQLQQWCHGKWQAHAKEGALIEELATDSRNMANPSAALFVALKTPLRDGHDFVGAAWERGVRSFLVSDAGATGGLNDVNVIQVADTLAALQQIAAGHRARFSMPVAGITGSNGKTIVKEWLYQVMNTTYNIVRSPQSFNSQVGVPLSVWQMNESHDLAIFEAGISQPGEMEKLETIIKPTIGIFTNIGAAHSEGFTGDEQKIREKLRLFAHAEVIIYCADHTAIHESVMAMNAGIRTFTWSRSGAATLRIVQEEQTGGATRISASYQGRAVSITIPFTDEASVENALHCWCGALLMNVEDATIAHQMAQLQPISMRLELVAGIDNCTIINDTYSSDLTSLQLALNYLKQQKQHRRHTVILSDLLQAGKQDEELYSEVADLLHRYDVNRLIAVGPSLGLHRAIFGHYPGIDCTFYNDTASLLRNFHLLSFDKEAILVKGARIFAFEKVSLLLQQKLHQTVLSIDLSALTNNLNVFRQALAPGVKTMVMVKAFSYGSGSFEIASLLQYAGVNYLAVAYTDEGIALRKAGITMPIMVMSPDVTTFDRMIAWKLEPEIFNFRSLEAFAIIARTLGVTRYPIHIKLDTGMHRLGFNEPDMPLLAERLQQTTEVTVATVFSHLAASDDPKEDAFTTQQATLFDGMSTSLMHGAGIQPIRHICNTAAIVRRPELQYDMVRLGLGLYGVDGTGLLQHKLQTVSTLKTTIAQVHELAEGENVGYGHHTTVKRASRIATVSIGYADGYPRSMGRGKAYMLVHGQQAPTVGSICMDMCMLDVTDIPAAREGDEVIVFSHDLPVTKLAEWAGTIPYEIMTSISQRVKRVYVNAV